MKIIQKHIPKSKQKRPGIIINPTSLTIHSTANPNSTAINERNWLTNPGNHRMASWHLVVDDKEVIEAIPLNEMAYHSGNSIGNRTSISIEICESGNREKTLNNAVDLTVMLLKHFNWGTDKLKRHFDWINMINGKPYQKDCPGILSYNNWEGWILFKIEVESKLRGDDMTEDRVREIVKEELNKNKGSDENHWANSSFNYLNDNGITIHEKRFDDNITRGEVFSLLERTIKLNK